MATVTGLTAARMIEMENATIIDGDIVGNDLILITRDATQINAGYVRGPIGPSGAAHIICTSSTRPVLTVQEEGKSIYETDTKLVRVWTGTSWRLQEQITCTSSTRPTVTADDEGVKIYETDTDTEYIWTGTSWVIPGLPPGSLSPTLLTVAPPQWVLMFGQTIANAQTLYPVLWDLVNSVFKSGSSLLVPDLRGRIPVGKDNMGGSTAGRLTSPISGLNGTVLGAVGGDQRMHKHFHYLEMFSGYLIGFSSTSGPDGLTLGSNYSGQTGTVEAGLGVSQNVQPSIVLNWMLKLV